MLQHTVPRCPTAVALSGSIVARLDKVFLHFATERFLIAVPISTSAGKRTSLWSSTPVSHPLAVWTLRAYATKRPTSQRTNPPQHTIGSTCGLALRVRLVARRLASPSRHARAPHWWRTPPHQVSRPPSLPSFWRNHAARLNYAGSCDSRARARSSCADIKAAASAPLRLLCRHFC